ncbi:hypothetical protein E2562_021634 [Oryza meyeriana var. granulata]|uniref:Uncharacterized protein n=1 Tax=Oryza meyeriana var. granulata TaxID=110450 RepID=A0A6G1E1V0_9ORYZ|nr:hypothetical protein E2562_026675 [Oryza meyeriana var. granulata]KAF0917913.1 hypothetical protein E2562_021634 [Oryza meyeriana var. granulata]
MAPPGSRRWAYVRVMAGTILGGVLGFYVMHRVETSYKARMEERLRRYEAHMLAKAEEEAQRLNDGAPQHKDQAQLLPDS